MSTVLLWTAWGDALMDDAELEPPNIQATESVNSSRGKRGAVVTADGIGKTMIAK